jgi:peptidoglycan hydrolase-like protein with peptidoglycan-binding domain
MTPIRIRLFALVALLSVFLLAAGQAGAAVLGAPFSPPADERLVQAQISVDEMPPEMRTAYIRGIQEELAGHGYRPGPADGIMGPATSSAIAKYQREAGLPVTGEATKELLDHLKFALPRVEARPEPQPDELVTEVQAKLSELGYYLGPVDGLAGSKTREAVRAYRYDAGLPVSGAIDTELLSHLIFGGAPPAEAESFTEPESADWPPEPEAGQGQGQWEDPDPEQGETAAPEPSVVLPTPPPAE